MPDYSELYRQYHHQMEDFWSRRSNALRYQKSIRVFGHTVLFDSNHEKVLDSATLAERMYSSASPDDDPAWRIHLAVHSEPEAPAPPERLIDRLHYSGAGDWLSIDLQTWGHCFVDMAHGEAYALLASSLADRPEQVCQVLVNTILTNLITRHGYGMLHASALLKGGNLLLLQAPHGTGKSTTALHLLLNGYRLLSDSMVYVSERSGNLWMGGFPVGRIRLRTDMLPLFPALAAAAQAERVRNETKHRIDLIQVDPALAQLEMIIVERVEYCLLQRWDGRESRLEPLPEEELWPEIMVNSLHYDVPELWEQNLQRIDALVRKACLHRLRIGTSKAQILQTIDSLWMR
jgi:hypothetical protein